MPPRYAYWTILIDNKPTAFRATSPDELRPTLFQLRRTNPEVTLKWFARGRVWDSPEAERDAQRQARERARPRVNRGAKPGGFQRDAKSRGFQRDTKPRGLKRTVNKGGPKHTGFRKPRRG